MTSNAEALREIFPGKAVIPVMDLVEGLNTYLEKRGYNPKNTLLAVSSCPDEVNREFDKSFSSHWGLSFTLSGLAGIPFVGKTGFQAYLSHMPEEDGRLLVVSHSHVGIREGVLGDLSRKNMKTTSKACGSAIAALHTLDKYQGNVEHEDCPVDDYQQCQVTKIVHKEYDAIKKSDNEMAKLSCVVSKAVLKTLRSMLPEELDVPSVFLNGVLVNTEPDEEDLFIPLVFGVRHPDGTEESWLSELEDILG
eukprot:m.4607 g.4607  ORF g.4607 m.4607 type:complete len:250 (+) comp3939_c0_seq1:515-1264(+)